MIFGARKKADFRGRGFPYLAIFVLSDFRCSAGCEKWQILLKSSRTAFSEIFFLISKGFAIQKQVFLFFEADSTDSASFNPLGLPYLVIFVLSDFRGSGGGADVSEFRT